MRKVLKDAESIKARVAALKDQPVWLLVNKGRKKIVKMSGVIKEVYPSLFSVKIDNSKSIEILSFSFSDMLCGDVKVMPMAGDSEKVSAE